MKAFPCLQVPVVSVPALVIRDGGQCAAGCSCRYMGKIRWYTPGDPAAWTMCGRISLFHTGVTAVRQSSQAWLCQTSSDAISWTVVYETQYSFLVSGVMI